jgi:STE24 endopeptidase
MADMASDPAARYHRIQLVLALVGIAVDALFLGGIAWTGSAHRLAALARRLTTAWWAEVLVIAALLGLAHAILTFPLGWLRGYHLPRRFGLLHQSFSGWLRDRAKAAALGALFAVFAVEATYALLRTTPYWWVVAAGVFWLASVAIATVFPVWIVPLFYRLTPLDDTALSARLRALAARAGIPVIGVYVVDQSRKSRTANAALAGIGRTRRIILFDTLVRDFTPDEIESVLAHELGHHVHADVWRGLAVHGVVTLASFWIADVVLRGTAPALGLPDLADPAGLPWVALVLGAAGFLALPFVNTASRAMEWGADDFALALTRDPDAFVGAMERLAALNLAERRPARLKEVLLHSHPSLDRRIARARARPIGAGRPG